MTLHLVRLPVNARALAAFAVGNGASDDDGGYALHLALRCRFGAAGPQPFRFFAEHRAGPHLLGYTADAAALTDAAALPATDPLLAPIFASPVVQVMPEEWRTGQRLRFEVRARPVVRFGKRVKAEREGSEPAKARENWWARAGEVDVWIAARTRGGDGGLWADNGRDTGAVRAAIEASPTRDTAYLDWLAKRIAGAAALEKAEVTQFRRSRTRRSAHGAAIGRARVEGPDAVLAGTLTVGDPAAFARLLARGVGRHAAFGYGMLLLSPPGR